MTNQYDGLALKPHAPGDCSGHADCVKGAALADRQAMAMRQDSQMNFGGLGAAGNPQMVAGGMDRG